MRPRCMKEHISIKAIARHASYAPPRMRDILHVDQAGSTGAMRPTRIQKHHGLFLRFSPWRMRSTRMNEHTEGRTLGRVVKDIIY